MNNDVKKRILVVDDEENIRFLYKVEFEDMGFEVETAENGAECIEHLKKSKNFELIILDIKMGPLNGLDTIKEIMNMRKESRVIFSSAYDEYKEDFNTWAADAYVIKSADLTELKDTVKKLLS